MEINVGDKVSFSVMCVNLEDEKNPIAVEISGVVSHIEGDIASVHTDNKFNDVDFIVKRVSDLTKK